MFKTQTADNGPKAHGYLHGLLASGESNLEKISETVVGGEYFGLQHFISDSPWDSQEVLDRLSGLALSEFDPAKPIGLLLDESGVVKKGNHSVGVAPQYCGNVGKIANSQVGVYASVCQGDLATLVDARLYLPERWCEDSARCDKARIPLGQRQFQTKIELALQLVKHQLALGTAFDFVHMDALYGASLPLSIELDQMGLCVMGDIRSNQKIYLEEPIIAIPPRKSPRGKAPTKPKPDKASISVKQYLEGLRTKDFSRINLRATAKGKLKEDFHFRKVWLWDGTEQQPQARTLIIRKSGKKQNKCFKFALANPRLAHKGQRTMARMHAQRFFIEHAFKEAKHTLGLSHFQTRKWIAWYHQIALVCVLLLFIMIEKIRFHHALPLYSAQDIKYAFLFLYAIQSSKQLLFHTIRNRHRARQRDINRFYQHDG